MAPEPTTTLLTNDRLANRLGKLVNGAYSGRLTHLFTSFSKEERKVGSWHPEVRTCPPRPIQLSGQSADKASRSERGHRTATVPHP